MSSNSLTYSIARASLGAVAVVALSLSGAHQAKAVSISPLVFELSANPGDALQNAIRVSNDQDYPVGVSVEIQDFSARGESGQVSLTGTNETTNFSLAQWVTASPADFTLDPRESKTVTFSIVVPPGAEPGGHYASVLVSISGGDVQGGGVGVAQKLGTLLLLNVGGSIKEEMIIEEFTVPEYSEYGPVPLVLRLKNSGTIHLKPRGFISIRNIFGNEVEKISIPQNNVLPGSIRRIEMSWGSKYQLGRYDAVLTAVYGSTNEPITALARFWIIPWKLITVVGVGILIIILFLYSIRKRLKLAFQALTKGKIETTGASRKR